MSNEKINDPGVADDVNATSKDAEAQGGMYHLYCPKCGHTWYSPRWDNYCPKWGCTGSAKRM